jgi:hypothetical protein
MVIATIFERILDLFLFEKVKNVKSYNLEASGENFLLARSCLLGILMIKIITLRSRQKVGDKID